MDEPYWTRPFFAEDAKEDDAAAAKRHAEWAMDVYTKKLNVVHPEDGMTFANKTAMWIAYERQLESERGPSKRLFSDPLAKYLAGPYGRLTSDVFAAMASAMIFDPNGDMGHVMKYNGFAYYHAARTKLVSVQLEKWSTTIENCQVINLGSGCDTRPFWDQQGVGNNQISRYVEVDTLEVNQWKETVLKDLPQEQVLASICPRQLISMDFAKESVKDLATSHGVEFDVATCWIMEGLIMYLEKEAVDQMLTEISSLSKISSKIMLNFTTTVQSKEHHSEDYCRRFLENVGWRLDQTLYFGDEGFNFGRFPPGKPPNKSLGFSFYSRI